MEPHSSHAGQSQRAPSPGLITVVGRTGALGKIAWLTLGVVLVIVTYTWLGTFLQGYEVKIAAHATCGDWILAMRNGGLREDLNQKFIQRAVTAGVHLKPTDFSFDVKRIPAEKRWQCLADIRYPVSAPWFVIGELMPQTPPLKLNEHLKVDHYVNEQF